MESPLKAFGPCQGWRRALDTYYIYAAGKRAVMLELCSHFRAKILLKSENWGAASRYSHSSQLFLYVWETRFPEQCRLIYLGKSLHEYIRKNQSETRIQTWVHNVK